MIAVGFFVAGMTLVGAYRWLALRYGWLDIPNARSSHTDIVPRGAGVVLVILAIAAAALTAPELLVRLLPGVGIAAIGWWDDLRSLSARVRFLGYGACAAAALLLLWGLPHDMPGWIWLAAGAIGLLWLVNLYNFMDGINGIATLEALFVLAAALGLSTCSPQGPLLHKFVLCILAALFGFLAWNFPRARVFMGDVGSAFLGFLLGLLALWSDRHGGPSLLVWGILGAVFLTDTSYTLLVRLATGQRWYAAHRLHAYQKLTTRWGGSHTRVTLACMAINVAWLLPIAWAVQTSRLDGAVAAILAYAPLLALCAALKAGVRLGTKV